MCQSPACRAAQALTAWLQGTPPTVPPSPRQPEPPPPARPAPRPYAHHRAYCTFYLDGSCGECIGRCPAGALTVARHDKRKCEVYVSATRPYVQAPFGFEGYGCGLCQTGVPCESEIPWAVRDRGTPVGHARTA